MRAKQTKTKYFQGIKVAQRRHKSPKSEIKEQHRRKVLYSRRLNSGAIERWGDLDFKLPISRDLQSSAF